jgi:aspartate aminotransferase
MINQKMQELGAKRSVIRELFEYGKKRKSEVGEQNVFDFSLGNPSVPAPKEVNLVLERLLREEDSVKLHGYTSAEGDLSVRRAIAEYINRTEGEEISPECVYMTVGAAAALTISLKALVLPDEEVITYAPYFPEYKVFVEAVGAKLVEVPGRDGDLLLDIENIKAHINEKTAAVMINSPNNPTGVVFDEENIKALADMLRQMSEKLGRTIYLISDEP